MTANNPTPVTTPATRAAATASKQTPPAPPAENRVADQITRHLLVSRTLRDGTRSTVLNLRPEHLGSVRVTVEMQSGQVRLGLTAGHAALSALQTDLPHLRAQLGQEGLTLTEVQTHTQDADTPAQNGSSRSDTTDGADSENGGRGTADGSGSGPGLPGATDHRLVPDLDSDSDTDSIGAPPGLDIRV